MEREERLAERVRRLPGRQAGVVELEGSPEMVLEVVSESSVPKDTVELPPLYHQAGVQEFWRMDARGELTFEILRRDQAGWASTQQPDGWWHSPVFGHYFHLDQSPDPLGRPVFILQARP